MPTDLTRRSTSKSIADNIGEFYEPGNPQNAVRLEVWRRFIAESFQLKDATIARTLRELLPLWEKDPPSQAFDPAIEQWVRLFHFSESLIMAGGNISVSEFLSRQAVEILRYWAGNRRAADRFELPARPATWTWATPPEEELSKISFPTVSWRFRVEKRTEFVRRVLEEHKQLLAERLDKIESRIAAMKEFRRTPGIRLNGLSHVQWAARMQVLGETPRESERPGVMKGVRHVFSVMGINPLNRRGRPAKKK